LSYSCYVYYRVRADRLTEAGALARALLVAVAERWPVNGRLARKVGEPLLWMEVYEGLEGDPHGFVAALEALADPLGIASVLADGERRHIEVFECA
jgi:hypothetical protein